VSDVEWVERARRGDEGAFRRLYERHVDRIYRLMYRMAGEEQLAMDFTQEAFVRAYRKLDQFRGESAFSTWLHRLVVSVALNELRRADRHRSRERTLNGSRRSCLPRADPRSTPACASGSRVPGFFARILAGPA